MPNKPSDTSACKNNLKIQKLWKISYFLVVFKFSVAQKENKLARPREASRGPRDEL